MNQTLPERLAKTALVEQQQAQMYALVDHFAEALQDDAMIHVLTRATMEQS